jgi:hypothetical protein
LVGPSVGAPCGRLPFELPQCPTCGGGVHPARGWQWIEPKALFAGPIGSCTRLPTLECEACPMGFAMPQGRHGLVWIGEAHYPTPESFLKEARTMGVSRKIKAVPNGFVLGQTVVYLAHRKAVEGPGDGTVDEDGRPKNAFKPGVFSVFRATGIDLVINDEDAIPEKAMKLAERHGARIVKVIPEELQNTPARVQGRILEMVKDPAFDDVAKKLLEERAAAFGPHE